MAATPAHAALSLLLTIDAPFMLCWGAALFSFWMYLSNVEHRRAWGLVLALSLGLGLLAKQTMLAFFPLALIYLSTTPEQRKQLASPALWVVFLGGCLGTLPILWWNYQHDWLTFTHTAHHFAGTPFTLLQVLKNLGELIGSQLAIVGPVLLPLLAVAAVASAALRHQPRWRFLLVFGSLPLLATLLLALHQAVNPNWPAPILVATVILVVAWALREPANCGRRRWLHRGLAGSLLFSVLAYVLPYLPLQEPVAGKNVDFLKRLHSWERLAVQVQQIRETVPNWPSAFMLTYSHRFLTSELAFYLPDRPPVYRWPREQGVVKTQYEIWGLPCRNTGASAVVVLASRDGRPQVPQSLRESFGSLHFLDRIEQDLGIGRKRITDVWLGREWRLPCS